MEPRKEDNSVDPKMNRNRRPTDMIDWIVVGIVGLWAAGTFIAGSLGYASRFSWERIWDVFFMGTGWIVLAFIPVRGFLPKYRRGVLELVAISGTCLGIGYQDTHLWISIAAWLVVGAILAFKLWQGLERSVPEG